jgi:nucleotide-binding universal stress UspA family protein
MERIVIATDGSPGARAAITEGLELALLLGAAVTFVAVRSSAPLFGSASLASAPHLSDELRETRSALEGAMEEAERAGVPADYEIAEGHVADEIVRTARYREADLIVVGSRGLGDIASVLLGSVSRELVEGSPLPVMVVKRPGAQADVTVEAGAGVGAG